MNAHPALLITADPDLSAAVQRLAAAAGVPLDVQSDPAAAARHWQPAVAVLVGADLAEDCTRQLLPRRDDLYLLALGEAVDATFRWAVALGAAGVVELPSADPWLVGLLADLGDGATGSAVSVAVVAGSGGAGASSLAAALGLTAATAGPTMLVDLDRHGPDLRRLVGAEDPPRVTWRDLAESQGRLGARALREALAGDERLGLLTWPDDPGPDLTEHVVHEVLFAARRGHDWLVVDAPRADPSLGRLVAVCDHVLLVVRPTVGGVVAAMRTAELLKDHGGDIRLVVRARRGAAVATEVGRALGLPVAAELPDQRRLDEHLDLGLGPVHDRRGPLAVTAARLVEQWSPR